MLADIKALRNIISTSVDTIINVCEGADVDFPSLDEPVEPVEFGLGSIRNQPKVTEAIALITAASAQLAAIVRPPQQSLSNATLAVRGVGSASPNSLL